MKSIDATLFKVMKGDANSRSNDLIQRAVTTNGIYQSSEDAFLSAKYPNVFSVEIESGKVTDQKNNGTCWLFAALNVLRHEMALNLKLDNFELSHSYSLFWDKLEKSNTFYEKIIETANLPLRDRTVDFYLEKPQYDSGWWEMSAAVIQKYGVLPIQAMPESASAANMSELNVVLNRKLRKDALVLRQLVTASKSPKQIDDTKHKMLSEVYRILTITIGTPPESFDFVYKDKDKTYHRENDITPLQFLSKYSKLDFDNYITLANDPSADKKYGQMYVIEEAKNIVEAKPFTFLNTEMDNLKALAREQLESNEAVWFGCHIQSDSTNKGYMSSDTYLLEDTFDADFSMTKADRLNTRDGGTTHAMTLTGLDVVDGKAKQWKVENSWGDKVGTDGYYIMSDEWMDKNVYVVVVRKDLLPAALHKFTDTEPTKLPIWDPIN